MALVGTCLWMASAGVANAVRPHAPLPQIALPCVAPSIEPISIENVQINQTDLLPATLTGSLRRPPYVQWTAPPYDGSSVYDDSVHLFNSGSLSAYQVYHRTYNYAGIYTFTADTQYALLKGHVDVRVQKLPQARLVRSQDHPSMGNQAPVRCLFDVQRRAPGQARWRLFRGAARSSCSRASPRRRRAPTTFGRACVTPTPATIRTTARSRGSGPHDLRRDGKG